MLLSAFCMYLNLEQVHVISSQKHALQIDSRKKKKGFWTEYPVIDINLTSVSFNKFCHNRMRTM